MHDVPEKQYPSSTSVKDAADDLVSTPGNYHAKSAADDKPTNDADGDNFMPTYHVIKGKQATPSNYRTETFLLQDPDPDLIYAQVQPSITCVLNKTQHAGGTVPYQVHLSDSTYLKDAKQTYQSHSSTRITVKDAR